MHHLPSSAAELAEQAAALRTSASDKEGRLETRLAVMEGMVIALLCALCCLTGYVCRSAHWKTRNRYHMGSRDDGNGHLASMWPDLSTGIFDGDSELSPDVWPTPRTNAYDDEGDATSREHELAAVGVWPDPKALPRPLPTILGLGRCGEL